MSHAPSAGGSEQRRAPRRVIDRIEGTLSAPGDVRVLDLSLHGIGLEAPYALEVGESCFLELRHEGYVASLELEVRWTSARRVERRRGTLVPVLRCGAAVRDIHRDRTGGIWDWIIPAAPAPAERPAP